MSRLFLGEVGACLASVALLIEKSCLFSILGRLALMIYILSLH